MGMTISSSGRQLDHLYLSPRLNKPGSAVVSTQDNPNAISKEKLIEMLQLENEYRLSAKWIELMQQECEKLEYPMHTIDLLQRAVVQQCGYQTDAQIENAIEYLRSAVALYPNDEEILQSANYLRFNRMRKFGLCLGSKFPDCHLYDRNLSDLLPPDQGYKFHFLISVSVT
mmetsp:Transcript_57400/g.91329  ORF Transcript_57400/g.91329 Transcript_57400/m.91329 type:complete len:171 (-) Transcript_57400:182-694(-)